MIIFVEGIAIDRVVGFEELGNKDDFPTLALTRRLIRSGVIMALNKAEKGQIIRKGRKDSFDSDDGEENWESKESPPCL